MPTILGANTLSTGYDVANSLRFDDGSSAYLNRTPSRNQQTNMGKACSQTRPNSTRSKKRNRRI